MDHFPTDFDCDRQLFDDEDVKSYIDNNIL